MKNKFKKLAMAVALIMCITLCLPAFSSLSVFAYAETFRDRETFSVEGFKTTAKLGDEYALIQPSTGAITKVVNPKGETLKDGANNIVSGNIALNEIGTYSITYKVGDYETDLTFVVSGNNEGYTLSFPVNTSKIVPSIINPHTLTAEERVISFPDAVITDEDGEIVSEGITIETKAYKEGETGIYGNWNATDKKLTIEDVDNATYKVVYTAKIGADIIADNSISIETDTSYENDYTYTYSFSSTKPQTAEIGKETILPGVQATNKDTSEAISVHYNITVKTGTTTYTATDADNDVLTINEDGQFVFNPVIAGNYTISYTVKDYFENTSDVASSSFTIEKVKDTTQATPIVTLPYNTTSKDVLTYKDDINTAFNLTADENYKEPIDANEALASTTENNSEFYLLPIYATDYSNGITDNNLNLYRTIKEGTDIVFNEENLTDADGNRIDVANKLLIFNASNDTKTNYDAYVANPSDADVEILQLYVAGKLISITASEIYLIDVQSATPTASENTGLKQELNEGSYTVNYFAKDANSGKSAKSISYTMNIDAMNDATNLTIKLPTNLQNNMLPGEKITFTATNPTDSAYDKRLSAYFSYTTNLNTTPVDIYSDDSFLTFDKETGEYTLEIPENATISSLILKVSTQTDNGTTAEKTKIITILNNGDATAITENSNGISIDLDTKNNGYKQGTNIYLPEAIYNDDLPQYVNVKIVVTDAEGNKVAVKNANNARVTASTYTVKNAYFVPETNGIYNIVYTAIDAGGNVFVSFYDVLIYEDTESWQYDIQLPASINNGTAERGEVVMFPTPEFVSTTDKLELGSYNIYVEGEGDFTSVRNISFTPLTTGTYTIYYEASILATEEFTGLDTNGSEQYYDIGDEYRTILSQTYTITVEDTTAPTLSNESNISRFFADLNNNGSMQKSTTPINLIAPQTDVDDINWDDSNVTISYLSTIKTLSLKDFSNLNGQIFNTDATYTITYNLVDNDGNKNSKTFTLDVGDVKAPEITVESGVINKKSYNIGDRLKVDLSKIQATDNVTNNGANLITKTNNKYVLNSDCEIEFYLYNKTTSSKVAIASDLGTFNTNEMVVEFDIETAGDYKLVIEVTDGQDKTATYEKITFSVAEDENEGATAEEVLGIVLIVVSVILLGGVITYFVVSRKAFEKKYK